MWIVMLRSILSISRLRGDIEGKYRDDPYMTTRFKIVHVFVGASWQDAPVYVGDTVCRVPTVMRNLLMQREL